MAWLAGEAEEASAAVSLHSRSHGALLRRLDRILLMSPQFSRRVRRSGGRGCARLSTVATRVQSAGKGSGEPGEVTALGMSSDEKEPADL